MNIDRDFLQEYVLKDGTPVAVRAIRPEDAAALQDGFTRLSALSRYSRFLSSPNELSESALEYLTQINFKDHVALIAFGPIAPGQRNVGLGVARFIRLVEEPEVAEAAVTVVDAAQERGLGKLLVKLIGAAALERGIRLFRAEVLHSNVPVHQILRAFDARLCSIHGHVQVLEIDLVRQAEEASRRP